MFRFEIFLHDKISTYRNTNDQDGLMSRKIAKIRIFYIREFLQPNLRTNLQNLLHLFQTGTKFTGKLILFHVAKLKKMPI